MRWIDEPPCTRLDLASSNATRLTLKGPVAGTRVVGGVTAGFGAVFGSFAVPFLKLPVPAPFKAIPLAFVAVGTGLGAVGAAMMTASISVEIDRKTGVTMRWRIRPMAEKTVTLAPEELEAFELSTHQTSVNSEHFDSRTVTSHRLNVITRAGKAYALEEFDLRTLAEQRKRQVESILFPSRQP